MADTQSYYDSPLTGEELDAAFSKIPQIDTAVQQASDSAVLSQSWTQGGTGTREGENTNNAKYWCNQAQTIAQGALGWYETEQALQAAHPTGQNGQWAIIGSTDTIWTWDSDTSAWVDSGAQMDLSNYYTKEQANAAFAPTSHANAETTYGAATGSLYGHVKLADTASASGASAGVAATPKCVQDATEYQPGDSISFNQIALCGFITTGATSMYYCVPLAKPVSSAVSGITATGGFTARGVNGYVEGSGINDFSNYAVYIYYNSSCALSLRIVKDSALEGAANNTPVSAYFTDFVIRFQ